jgi:hypothetical protein
MVPGAIRVYYFTRCASISSRYVDIITFHLIFRVYRRPMCKKVMCSLHEVECHPQLTYAEWNSINEIRTDQCGNAGQKISEGCKGTQSHQLCHGLEEYPDIFLCRGLASHGSRSTSVLGVIEPSAPPNERPLAADGEEKLVKGL